MTDNPIAPVTKGGGKLVASLKGHKPVVYAAVGTGAVGLALYLRHKNALAAQQQAVPTAQDPNAGFVDPNAVDPGGSTFGSDGAFASTPAATQGAFFGNNQPLDTQGLVDAITAAITPSTPTTPAADTPTTTVTVPGAGTVVTPAPVAAPPPPAIAGSPAANEAPITGGGLPVAAVAAHVPPPDPAPAPAPIMPILGPNIFYMATRGLRYIVQAQVSASTRQTCNYRHYESALNRGDWGQGGVILIAGSCR